MGKSSRWTEVAENTAASGWTDTKDATKEKQNKTKRDRVQNVSKSVSIESLYLFLHLVRQMMDTFQRISELDLSAEQQSSGFT